MPVRQTLALILLLAPMSAPTCAQADAGQAVHRCVGRHGEIVFSGLSCAATDAATAPIASTDGAASSLAMAACPASFDELRDRTAGAVTRHDANALANLLRWRGVGAEAAAGRLHVLRDLVKRPLLAIDGGDGNAEPSVDTAPAHAGLRVRTGSNESGGTREHAFGSGIDDGCYWLLW